MASRWSCGPLALGFGDRYSQGCDLEFDLNYFRYVRQIQIGKAPRSTKCRPVVLLRVEVWRKSLNTSY